MPKPLPPLLICATAPVVEQGSAVVLDIKFVEGMREHCHHWPGPVRCILRRGAASVPFGAVYAPGDLGFDLHVLDPGAPLPEGLMEGAGALYAALDDMAVTALIGPAQRAGMPVVLTLEYTLETRLRIALLDETRSLPRRLWSALWVLRSEPARRRTLRAADGVQFNGYPAESAYRALSGHSLLYLDNRMTPALMATPAEMEARATRLRGGAPLRLIHSGRLEPMKGAQDLLPVMAALRAQGISATLDIYGTGSLEGTIAAGLEAFDGAVRLHAPVDFEQALVPVSRTSADLFLSCHRQSDPSCTYIEAMGCGLAVAGYANRMWQRLAAVSGGGPVAPLGDVAGLAAQIAALDRDREKLLDAAACGLAFARAHDFPGEFARRMDHLKTVARLNDPA